ncbi:hypothetical protein [Paraburkholderia sp. MM5384-R2]|uniref:hypothetical protein n=1 Tax=Paraburkholderia sp. MM5384-R2 TaxID=2723097 RepID=UPI001620B86B|nr:hypothetical protein [Paraburkholderia sp. MM5384-R2]MBB5502091.1 hypothetical protein [Paraburkholderia sp. MM5384-R2]
MLKKLKMDALAADLSSVNALLASRSSRDDPTGVYQFRMRKAELERQLEETRASYNPHASVAIFFGGEPVQGSRGINADFAGGALDDVQELIRKCLAARELGALSERGRVPLKGNAQLVVTDVARGSFGFVLEEAGDDGAMIDTVLKDVVDEVAELLGQISSASEAEFQSATEALDGRILLSLRKFFKRLDDSEATVRLVEDERDVLLDRIAVNRARARTEAIEIDESGQEFQGALFLLPDSKRFELHTSKDGDAATLSGPVSRDVLRQLAGEAELGQPPINPREISRTDWRVLVKVREIRERGRTARTAFTLVRLIAPCSSAAN